MRNKYHTQITRHRHGLTFVELLIALTITALLLTAVAVAFNSSVINYRENKDMFTTINNARQALHRITTQLRTAQAVDPNAPENECAMTTADYADITYQYNATDQKLYLIDTSSGSPYVLCDNVADMTFQKNTDVDDEDEVYVKSVQISMTVQSKNGHIRRTISSAAVIRKNLQ